MSRRLGGRTEDPDRRRAERRPPARAADPEAPRGDGRRAFPTAPSRWHDAADVRRHHARGRRLSMRDRGRVPAELPVVLAAAQAILEPDFNLLGIATTTGSACVALCVHGPIARKLGVNALHQLHRPRHARQCLHRPRAAALPAQHRRRALRNRRHGHHGPARQVHALLRRARRRPLPHPDRAPGPRQGRERDHGDGHLRHGRGAAGRRRRRHARGDPRSDRRRHARRDRHVRPEPQEPARRAGLPAAARDWRRRSPSTTAGTSSASSNTCSTRARTSPRAPEAIHPIVTGGAGYKMAYLPIWGGGSQTVMRKL